MDSMIYSTVTFGVIAYNEQKYLPDLLEDLLNQNYDTKKIEVVFVDGESTDETRRIMADFKREHQNEFYSINIFNNKNRIQPSGWNIVINHSTSEIILRIDAHARLPKDFISKNVYRINSGEDVCGGPRTNIIDNETKWSRMLLEAEQSMFGSGIAKYRRVSDELTYVKSVFHGAYKRKVFDEVGLFNEKLVRTEDNEIHYRIRQSGYRICYDPSIQSYYQTRNTWKKMIKQKNQNGCWIGRTLYVCPRCISLFHLIPCCFCLSIILSIVLFMAFNNKMLLVLVLGLYTIANIVMTISACITSRNRNIFFGLLPFVFLSLHFAYGIGTLAGVLFHRKAK